MVEINQEKLRCTKGQIEDFKSSMLWKDIIDELNQLSNNAQLEYDIVGESHTNDAGYKVIPNSSETLIHLGDIKGRRKAVQYFLSLPDIFLNILEDQAEEKKDDS